MGARVPISLVLAMALTALFAVCLARPAAAAGVAAGITARDNFVPSAAGGELRGITRIARRRAYRPWPFYPHYSHYPYYRYGPRRLRRHKMSCATGARLLRRYGYRGVRATDCRGGAYGYTAYLAGRRYRIRLGAYSGDLLSRWRD